MLIYIAFFASFHLSIVVRLKKKRKITAFKLLLNIKFQENQVRLPLLFLRNANGYPKRTCRPESFPDRQKLIIIWKVCCWKSSTPRAIEIEFKLSRSSDQIEMFWKEKYNVRSIRFRNLHSNYYASRDIWWTKER